MLALLGSCTILMAGARDVVALEVCVLGVGVEVGNGENAQHTKITVTITFSSEDFMRTKSYAKCKNMHVVLACRQWTLRYWFPSLSSLDDLNSRKDV